MIREYCPAQNSFDSCVIAGAVEDLKHESPREAAAHELEEEAHLIGDGTAHTYPPLNMQQLTNTTLKCIIFTPLQVVNGFHF